MIRLNNFNVELAQTIFHLLIGGRIQFLFEALEVESIIHVIDQKHMENYQFCGDGICK